MNEKVIEFLTNCLPALIAGLACILTMFKVLGGINEWKGSINATNLKQLDKDMKNVIKKNQQLIQQNEEYKNEIVSLKEEFKNMLTRINALAEELQQASTEITYEEAKGPTEEEGE